MGNFGEALEFDLLVVPSADRVYVDDYASEIVRGNSGDRDT